MQYYKLKQLAITIGACLAASTLTACGSGGSNSIDGSKSGGGDGSFNIQPVVVLSSILNATYTATCIYNYGNTTYLVNGDGSGTGVGLNLGTGQVSSLSNLAKINIANGDVCLSNFGQLTWTNKNSPYTINIFDPDSNKTEAIDLSHAGISGSTLSTLSYDYDLGSDQLYANSTFLDDGYVGFSKFSLLESTVTNT
jgi:hypothetical protein